MSVIRVTDPFPIKITGSPGAVAATAYIKGRDGEDGADGPQGLPGVNAVANDTATAGYISSTSSDTSTALDGYAVPSSQVLYVDPTSGNDSFNGKTWKKAFATIQAAVTAAPTGAMVVLAATDHDVADGVTMDRAKALTITGVHPLRARQHATTGYNQTRLFSSSATSPDFFLTVTDGASNVYGWTFKHFYVDGNTLALGGGAIYAHGLDRVVVEDVCGRALSVTGLTIAAGGDNRYLVKSDMGLGNDASWWTLRNCVTYGMRGALATTANYWSFPGCSFMGVTGGTKPTGPAVSVEGSQTNLNGLHCEGWQKAVKVQGRGPHGQMASEWTDIAVHLYQSYDAVITLRSAAGSGVSEVVDENGVGNVIIGARNVSMTGTTERQIRVASGRGTSPMQNAGDWLTPLYAPHPSLPNPASEVYPSPLGNVDIALANGLISEYWNGSAWVAWQSAQANNALHTSDASGMTIDATHKRCRYRTDVGNGNIPTQVIGQLSQSAGTIGTVAVRVIATDATTVLAERVASLGDSLIGPSQVRGFLASLAQTTGQYVEVELNLGLTGAETATLKRLHMYHPGDYSGTVRGARFSTSRYSPEGRVTGGTGDFVLANGASGTDNAETGFYRKTTSSGNTGWAKATFRTRFLSVASVQDVGSIAAQSVVDTAITLTGVVAGDMVHVSTLAAPPAGIIVQGFATATNTVTLRLTNVTGAAIDPASNTYNIETYARNAF